MILCRLLRSYISAVKFALLCLVDLEALRLKQTTTPGAQLLRRQPHGEIHASSKRPSYNEAFRQGNRTANCAANGGQKDAYRGLEYEAVL
jgi:hypothetical protein